MVHVTGRKWLRKGGSQMNGFRGTGYGTTGGGSGALFTLHSLQF